MLKRVVSFEPPIERTESIFRLLQNRPENDRARVADRLAQSPDSNARSIAEMISRHAS
jgi:predicted FMN-binding regulatory protein PaiB